MDNNFRIHNKSSKPDNVVEKENQILENCSLIERELPTFLRGFFIYLKGDVLPMTRFAYLSDIRFFFNYLIENTDLTNAKVIKDISIDDINALRAVDINIYLDYCRRYSIFDERNNTKIIYENSNKTLARKKSSVSVMFKYLYRDELISKNITDGFDPIRVSKPGEREIKALTDEEVLNMLNAVSYGEGLTEHERSYWEKTKFRDKTILILFLTYGLRLSELQQLNLSSFNFNRGEFKIYRKRGKEAVMPLNKSVHKVLEEYIELEYGTYPRRDKDSEEALFLSIQGKRMTDRQIRQLVKKYTSIALNTSRGGGFSPHKLRATAATSLIGRGNSIYDVAALLDHEQVTTTQLYAKHKADIKKNLVNDMEWEKEREENNE